VLDTRDQRVYRCDDLVLDPWPGESAGGVSPPAALRVKSTAGEVPLAGSFSVGLFPNRACKFPRTLHASLPSL
jgi:hypothetical protein